MSHGITQFSSRLDYHGQTGALNESFSDVFGIMTKQWARQEVGEAANWLFGDELLVPVPTRRALRDLRAPGTAFKGDPDLGDDPQPAHMRDYKKTEDDDGGVHINSGIPNRAFYLACVNLGGPSWEKAGQIWYRALTRPLPASADFLKCAEVTISVAGEVYDDAAAQAVAAAWNEVGVVVSGGSS
ncbi:M4 family metallopeptidase [Phaeospirillum tilakii]|uniref:M4 family metallopeptidase n=1 Tax=Phaeospirillum tilakii TaxID=741673 RepID=A0ABW5CC77_9PROT